MIICVPMHTRHTQIPLSPYHANHSWLRAQHKSLVRLEDACISELRKAPSIAAKYAIYPSKSYFEKHSMRAKRTCVAQTSTISPLPRNTIYHSMEA